MDIRPPTPALMGGIFSEILNVAGAYVGDPALGDQLASKALRAYAPIKQTPQQIADEVTPQVLQALKSSAVVDIDNLSVSIAQAIAPYVAVNLNSQGVVFNPGTLGASYTYPSLFGGMGSWLSSAVHDVGGWVAGDGNAPGNDDTRSLGYDKVKVAAATANLLNSPAPVSLNRTLLIVGALGLGALFLMKRK